MKAIIPVAGAGANLRPHTYTQPKALMTLAGKTVLGYIIEQMEKAGIKDFIFIIGYLGEKIRNYVQATYPEINSSFIIQNERMGIGDAVLMAKDLVGNEEVFITLGDTVSEFDVDKVIHTEGNLLGLMTVDDPRSFGVAELDEDDKISKLIEKPAIPKSNKALVGLYKIQNSNALFASLQKVKDSNKNTLFSLTEGLDDMLQDGLIFIPFKVKFWHDCGRKESVLKTNAILLSQRLGQIDPSTKQINSIIIHPVSIAPNVTIENSIIGPNVSIGSNARISASVVKECIIGSYTFLHEVVLDNSIIGSDAEIRGMSRSLNIGDNTEIDFG